MRLNTTGNAPFLDCDGLYIFTKFDVQPIVVVIPPVQECLSKPSTTVCWVLIKVLDALVYTVQSEFLVAVFIYAGVANVDKMKLVVHDPGTDY